MLTQETLAMLRTLAKDATTTGITTGTGLVYYNHEAEAKRLYPVNTPLRNRIPRVKSPTAGPGTAAQWKAITAIDGPGTAQYPGLSEGHRNAFMPLTEKNFVATFAALGKDIPTTFEAQFAGQGFDDARAIAQTSKLNALMISEEKMLLWGNSGNTSGHNGFQLGTAATPTAALAGTGSITTGKYVSGAVVLLTGWGLQFASVANGVVTSFTRTNADGSSDTINGGSSAISAMSNVVTTSTGQQSVKFVVTPTVGTLGYAWFVDVESTNTSVLANAKLAAITSVPTYTATALPIGTQTGTASGMATDNSANLLDFDGLLTWAASRAV